MGKFITLKRREPLSKKKKSEYQKKPKGKLELKPVNEAERAIKALRYENIGLNDPHDRIFRTSLKRFYAEAE